LIGRVGVEGRKVEGGVGECGFHKLEIDVQVGARAGIVGGLPVGVEGKRTCSSRL
jgi:hypothetical protein